jgi:hypothetical protein
MTRVVLSRNRNRQLPYSPLCGLACVMQARISHSFLALTDRTDEQQGSATMFS